MFKGFVFYGVCAFLLIGLSIVHYLYWDYPLSRDVWDRLDRAQTSAESEDMLVYVIQAIHGLENKKGLFSDRPQTEGHCALIFKKPNNSLEAQYRILRNIRARLERTITFDKNSIEYATSMDDIRGTIRELQYLDCWIWHFS